MFPILLKSSRIRNKLISYLNSKNIGASVHFDPPVHKQGAYKNIDVSLKNTEISSKIATLPISSMQTTSQTKFVINNIKSFCLMKVGLFIPLFNEEDNIQKLFNCIDNFKKSNPEINLVIICI